jgi:hypothetical protein
MKKILSFSFLVVFTVAAAPRPAPLVSATARPPYQVDVQSGAFLIESVNGNPVCRDATPSEAARINRRSSVPLKVFGEDAPGRIRSQQEGESHGLNIILRGTEQLDAQPAAKAAFERAAEIWESRIASPITVYVDVDYGETLFGEPFSSENVIAATRSLSYIFDEGGYPELRDLILASANSDAEDALYAALPQGAIPTDKGPTTRFGAASMLLRALGVFEPVATEVEDAPLIGFNSKFVFDLDPSDGITVGQTDFEGVVVHEIGHMLGFTSRVGAGELGNTDAPSILDLFRFRPGVNSDTFTSAERILSSGGAHRFYAGSDELGLSTGRPDGTGGDERQASHWEDDNLSGIRIGIMDPTLGRGRRSELTDNDLFAFGILGYRMATDVVEPEPEVPPVAPTALAVTALSATSVRLTWTDNSANETEFRIEQKLNGTFVDVGPADANATTRDVGQIAPGSTNTFRVRARGTAGDSAYTNEASVTTPGLPFTCTPDATTVCLNGNRFRVTIAYRNQFAVPVQTGNFVGARLNPAATNPDTAIFGFANPMDVEVVVRVVDARPFAPRFDLYYGGLTDVEYTVTVADSVTGISRTYKNNPGQVGGGVDRTTFPAN